MLRKICRALTHGLCRVAVGAVARLADRACSQIPATGQPNRLLAVFEAMRDRFAAFDQFKVGQTLTLPVR